MKVYATEHPGEITDLGNGTYFRNTNIQELTNPETGDIYFEFEAELCSWPTEPTVPQEVYAWRLRVVAKNEGLKDYIDAFLDELPTEQRDVAMEAWHNGVTIRRDSPLISQIASALDLTEVEVDGIFIQANSFQI